MFSLHLNSTWDQLPQIRSPKIPLNDKRTIKRVLNLLNKKEGLCVGAFLLTHLESNSFIINTYNHCYPFCHLQFVCTVCLQSVSNIFRFLPRITREKLVTAIWKVKPILKWEIDSIQAVIDEEKENLQGKGHEILACERRRIFSVTGSAENNVCENNDFCDVGILSQSQFSSEKPKNSRARYSRESRE